MKRLFQKCGVSRFNFSTPVFLKQLFICLIFFSPTLDIQAQSIVIPSDFNQTFEREMQRYNQKETAKRRTLRSSLPTWWNQVPVSGHDTIYMIGISDPGLPDTLAKAQAHLRAVALSAFCRRSSVVFFSDYYKKSVTGKPDAKFQEIYRFDPGITPSVDNTRITRSKKLRSGEFIVWVAIPLSPDQPPTNGPRSMVLCYANETSTAAGDALMWKTTVALSMQKNPVPVWLPDTTHFYLLNNKFVGVGNLTSRMNRSSRYDYLYTPLMKNTVSDTVSPPASTCSTGLWIALINSIFQQTTAWVRKSAVQTRLLQEQTNGGRNELNRETTALSFHFEINELRLTSKGLTTNLHLVHEK
jgi:hypothetical protein